MAGEEPKRSSEGLQRRGQITPTQVILEDREVLRQSKVRTQQSGAEVETGRF